MPLKMTRRRFAGLSAAAAASVWVRPLFGETHQAAEWVNPLIGASTSQKLGEGKTFPGPTINFSPWLSGSLRTSHGVSNCIVGRSSEVYFGQCGKSA